MEVVVTLAVICAEVWVFRWIVARMPVLGLRPAWAERQEQMILGDAAARA
jgi:hypothetical protein